MRFGPDRRNTSRQLITGRSIDPVTGDVTLDIVPLEDTVHPVELAFDPPYQELAAEGNTKAFSFVWEKLTFAFHLSDPAQFPALTGFTDEDLVTLSRYVAVCRKLASYTAIAHDSYSSFRTVPGQAVAVTAQFPDDESQVAAAARFRQLNKEGEPTSFIAASNIIAKAVKAQCPDRMPEVGAWRKSRGELLNRTLYTIVCGMLLPEGRPSDAPLSYDNIHPEDLFNAYFYGDWIHVGNHVDKRLEIDSSEINAAYHMRAYLMSMSALAHLYFGFAVLVEHATQNHVMAATVHPEALQLLATAHGWETTLEDTSDGRLLRATRGTIELTVVLDSDTAGQFRVTAWVRDDRAESTPATSTPAPTATLLAQVRELVTADPKD
ncbi:MAG: hypothetical protein H6523_13250 [Mycolicibacterium sp.]|nr:hypothetical protein [Mycolicibacterium sp.]